jgi:CTD small phosphatase-like protein 2
LDLDETLVHCSTEPADLRRPDFVFDVEFNGQLYQVHAKKRPGLEDFLEFIKDRFEVVIFTASQRVYADKLLDIVDPRRQFIRHRVFRDDCICVENNYLKDLTVLGRDLTKTVIVDNSPQAFSYQLDNGIPILSWYESDDDRELYKIIPFLHYLNTVDDVRPAVRNRFQLFQKVEQNRNEFMWN